MTLADKTVMAVATRALAFGLGFILLTTTVFNDSPYRVTDVRLQVEGLDADHHLVGRTLAWAIGDIAPGGETSFVAEPMPGAVRYRITVVSYDLVSLGQAP